MAQDEVKGVADECIGACCALIGGEIAEMAGMYNDSSYDIAGFALGAYEKGRDRSLSRLDEVIAGDVGVASTGLHSNGFSLLRKIVESLDFKRSIAVRFDEISRKTFADSYRNLLQTITGCSIKKSYQVSGAHNWGRLAGKSASCSANSFRSEVRRRTLDLSFCIVVSSDFADDFVEQCRRLIDLEVFKVGHMAIGDDSKPIVVDDVKQALKRSYVKG